MIALRTNKAAKTIPPHGVVFIDDDSVVTSELADNFYYVRGKYDAGCKEMSHRGSRYTLRGIEEGPKEPWADLTFDPLIAALPSGIRQ